MAAAVVAQARVPQDRAETVVEGDGNARGGHLG